MIHRWWHLAIRNSRARFARTLAQSLAVIVACALVTFITSWYSSAEDSFIAAHHRWVGSADIQINTLDRRSFPQDKLAVVGAVPGVQHVSARLHDRAQIVSPAGKASVLLKAQQVPEDYRLHTLALIAGRALSGNDAREVVLERGLADELAVHVGDVVQVKIYDRSFEFTVAAIADGAPLAALIPYTVYMPLAAAQEILDHRGLIDTIFVQCSPGANREETAKALHAALGGKFAVRQVGEEAALIAQNLPLLRAVIYILSSVVLTVAVFLVFATQTCGLIRRVSEMGTLRCLGATRAQVVRLVLYESVPLALWGVLLGVPLGLLGSYGLIRHYRSLLAAPWSPSAWGLVLACAGTFAAVIVGSLLPAVAAARASVIRSYRPRGGQRRRWPVPAAGLIGAALVAAELLWVLGETDARRAVMHHAIVGVPMLMLGLLLMLPMLFSTLGRGVAAIVGGLCGVGRQLLIENILRARWRSSAIAASVALCVALVVSAQTQTESLIAGTKLPVGFPDMLAIFPAGIPQSLVEQTFEELGITQWTGVNGFDVETPAPKSEPVPSMLRLAMGGRGGNTWFLAFDPQRMQRVVQLEFLEGNAADAMAKLEQGDSVIVPKAYARLRGLKLGDKVLVRGEGHDVPFEIAGVVESPSLDAVDNFYGLGEMYLQNSAYTIIGSMASAREHFYQRDYSVLLIDTGGPAQSQELHRRLRHQWPEYRAGMIYASLGTLKKDIEQTFRSQADLLSWAAGLLSAAVASLGAANAMRAGVLSRRRELGVLRALGLTRGGLLRMILAEAIVLGTVGAAAGVGAGLVGAISGLHIHKLLAGLHGHLTLPLMPTLLAVAMATGAAVVASLYAALEAGRADVLASLRE